MRILSLRINFEINSNYSTRLDPPNPPYKRGAFYVSSNFDLMLILELLSFQ